MKTLKGYLHAVCCLLLLLVTGDAVAQRGVWHSPKNMTSASITTLAQDQNGYLWIGTEFGLNRFDGYRYSHFMSDEADPHSLSDNSITALFAEDNGTFWVGTTHGLNRYVPEHQCFEHVDFGLPWQPHVKQLLYDQYGNLCCATSGFGLWHVKGNSAVRVRRSEEPSAEDDYFQSAVFDGRQRFWRADQRGLVTCYSGKEAANSRFVKSYETQLGEVISIVPHTTDTIYVVCQYGLVCYDGRGFVELATTRNKMELTSALHLDNGRLLLGTLANGLWCYDAGHQLRPLECSAEGRDTHSMNVTALLLDGNGNLWVGCDRSGLFFLPMTEQSSHAWNLSDEQPGNSSELTSIVDVNGDELLVCLAGYGLCRLRPGQPSERCEGMTDATCVYRDAWHHYWVATSEGIFTYDVQTERAKMVLPLPDGNVNCLTADVDGRLYISTYGHGLLVFDPESGNVRTFDMYHPIGTEASDRLCNDWVKALLTDSQGNIWIATASGVSCYNPSQDTFVAKGWNVQLNDRFCLCLAEDAAGQLLVGTNQGIFAYDDKTRECRPLALGGLPELSRSVRGIVTMPDQSFWLSTSHGVWLYDPERGDVVPFTQFEGRGAEEYNPNVMLKTPEGWVLFGRGNGLLSFHPETVLEGVAAPVPLRLTAFLLDNEMVKPGQLSGGRPVYEGELIRAQEFRLDYLDNSFTMAFSPLNSNVMTQPQIQYAVNGERWTDVSTQDGTVAFSHLPPGNYEIRVRASSQDMYSAESLYRIKISPPWYASWLAKTIYGLLVIAFVCVCVSLWYRHKQNQVEDEKMQLLIDATHDIRTPLTLILSPLHQLAERHKEDEESTRRIRIIEHNTHRILNLVNQILDIRRFDKQQMPFNPQPTDLVRFVNDNLLGFEYEAQKRNIQLRFSHEVEPTLMVSFDRTQFEKVVVNLVGNALKFTPDGGQIDVRLALGTMPADGAPCVEMQVADTGIGLPDGETEKIFHRFYQTPTTAEISGDGTGIGLNLCLKVMEQHGGTIRASARPDGQSGSVFTVSLPLREGESKPVRQPSRAQRILVVDDDQEIADYIVSELAGRYRCESCSNGLEALQLLLSDPKRFDVVVSDIKMPEMDGLTLLRSIRSNNQIAHVPVLLLTTETEISNRLEGLSAGADAYLSKPFVMDELRVTLDSLIANSQRHRSRFGGNVEAIQAAASGDIKLPQGIVAESDSHLLERVTKSVTQHLSQPDFGVDELCAEVGISRSQLHRKMKELTGVGAGEFVRNIRLEQAARLLRETDLNVSQVAYAVSFSNIGHFSKIFRQHFGVFPSEYGAQKANDNGATPEESAEHHD